MADYTFDHIAVGVWSIRDAIPFYEDELGGTLPPKVASFSRKWLGKDAFPELTMAECRQAFGWYARTYFRQRAVAVCQWR